MNLYGWNYKRVQRINFPGHAHFITCSCYQRLPLLTNELWRVWLATEIRHACDTLHVSLWAYVFMPEHVHLLVYPTKNEFKISSFLWCFKKRFAQRVIAHLKETHSPLLDKLAIPAGYREMHRYWQAGGGYDVNIHDTQMAIQKAAYCHLNPVKRGLVANAVQWTWSSYRWLEMNQREHAPLRLDEWNTAFRDSGTAP